MDHEIAADDEVDLWEFVVGEEVDALETVLRPGFPVECNDVRFNIVAGVVDIVVDEIAVQAAHPEPFPARDIKDGSNVVLLNEFG